jgi:hypothetical protein
VAIAYPVLLFRYHYPKQPLLIAGLVFVLLFPLVFFRHSRSLWIGFDQWRDPHEGERPQA